MESVNLSLNTCWMEVLMEVALMARRKPLPKPRTEGSKPERRPVAVTMKGSEEWKEWLERAAAHSRMSVSMFLDFATVQYAKSQGFDEPPPDR